MVPTLRFVGQSYYVRKEGIRSVPLYGLFLISSISVNNKLNMLYVCIVCLSKLGIAWAKVDLASSKAMWARITKRFKVGYMNT